MNLTTISFLFFVLLLIPFLAISSDRQLGKGGKLPQRKANYLQTMWLLGVLGLLSVTTGAKNQIVLWPEPSLNIAGLVAGVIILALWLLSARYAWNILPDFRRKNLLQFLPQTPLEKFLWVVMCLFAAVSEELAYRGVLVALLSGWLGNWYLAILISSLVFAVSHMTQGARSVLIIIGFALCLHILVRISGNLYVAIAVHLAYNLVAGNMTKKYPKVS